MTPSPSSASGELWGYHLMPHDVNVDVMLPNGLLITQPCVRETTLRAVKEEVWKEAKRCPLFNILQNPSTYVFVVISQDGEREEIYDESRRLCDLRLFWPVLRLVEPVGNREEKSINYDIGVVIGRQLLEFDETRDTELIQARLTLLTISHEVVKSRTQNSDVDMYSVPCDIIKPGVHLPKLFNKEFLVCVWVCADDSTTPSNCSQKLTLKFDTKDTPLDVIKKAIISRTRKLSASLAVDNERIDTLAKEYLLKVAGLQLYFLENCALVSYKYMQKCFKNNHVPQVMLMSRAIVTSVARDWQFFMPSFVKRHVQPTKIDILNDPSAGLLWEIDSLFRVKIISASYINLADVDEIYVKVGIFHGPELLNLKNTQPVQCSNPRWNEILEFDISNQDIPSAAQICFSIMSIKQNKKKDSSEHNPLAWANLRLMDYEGRFLAEKMSLHLWPFPKSFEGNLNPYGHNNSNPNRDMPCLELEFQCYDQKTIYFPPNERIVAFLDHWNKRIAPKYPEKLAVDPKNVTEAELATFRDVTNRDALHELSEQEKETMWRLRNFCQQYENRNSLPRLLDVTRWASREEAAQMYIYLEKWPAVNPKTAMELLDIKYPDKKVRCFAVKCLDQNLSDDELNLYLIYLVQVLKYEPFLENDLSKFLLKRALQNQRIGHVFFWLLRAELMHNQSWTKFGLLLEAYCRGCGPYLKSLLRQVEAVEKLTLLNNMLKERKEDPTKILLERLEQNDFLFSLQHFESPLDCSTVLGDLVVKDCRVMMSAKRPLWLVWKNVEPHMNHLLDPTREILFKTGDDLRQDMLTLQVLRIMDSIWRAEGKDFFLTPYNCLPMGKHIGMIEGVRHSKTILEIQNTQGKMGAFNIGFASLLHKWIRDHNKKEKYDEAIERFTRSCAGYCVATFVLGIRDRHSSNIMITEDGRIFHIDFGHFLGHYKKKFGINRERVPFVLTEDFIYVIAKGSDNPKKSQEYKNFQRLCVEAYSILHKHARLFVTLFTMMLCMGIPELQKLEDIHYLRRTLAVDKNEAEAINYFNQQLSEAHEGAWTTKVDWFFHSVRHSRP